MTDEELMDRINEISREWDGASLAPPELLSEWNALRAEFIRRKCKPDAPDGVEAHIDAALKGQI